MDKELLGTKMWEVGFAGGALLVAGIVVGRVGFKLGTAISVVLTLGWFVMLAWLGVTEALQPSVLEDLALHLLVGLTAFLVGVNAADGFGRRPRSHRDT